jgi:hypothetical protein
LLISNTWFQGQNPLIQYIVYNLGIITSFTVMIGVPVSYFLEREVNVWAMIKSGIAAFILFAFVLDMVEPPLAYDTSGNLLITNSSALPGTAVDRVAGWAWTGVGVTGYWLYFTVYIITPIIAAISAALLLKPREFLSRLHA